MQQRLFSPYLETQDAWAVLHRPKAGLITLAHYGREGFGYLGSVLLLLSAVALLDRLRGTRWQRDYDPRLIFLVAGLFSVWASVGTIPIPLSDARIPSLYVLASELVPGLHAVRAGHLVRAGALIAGAFLAGLGFSILSAGGGTARRALLVLLLTTASLAEVFFPQLARDSFRHSLAMRPYFVRPMPGLVELYTKGPPGPVLDLVPRHYPVGPENQALGATAGVYCPPRFWTTTRLVVAAPSIRSVSTSLMTHADTRCGTRPPSERWPWSVE